MKRILCIEDDRDLIENYQRILQQAGYEVDSALDGDSGFAKAKQRRPDLIILDVMMKDSTDGFHVAYRMRSDETLKHVPILMLTAVASVSGFKFDKNKDAEFLPVDAFIDKPISPDKLLASVASLLKLPQGEINIAGEKR